MKVGDYVRTKYGISKIISNPNENTFNIDIYKKDRITLRCIKQRDVIKTSPNIIDLIEVGDYVNGEPVKSVLKDCEGGTLLTASERGYLVAEEDIEMVVTKEQFEEMEYNIGE